MNQYPNTVQPRLIVFLFLAIFSMSCGKENKKLPIYGERDWTKRVVDGKEVVDTIYHTIPPFQFVNQFGDTVSEQTFKGQIYVSDFFFTSCPTICPVMKRQMIKIYNHYKGNPQVKILSHTIDPDHDTPQVLSQYAKDLGVAGDQWEFVTGPKDKIYSIGEKSYMVTTKEDEKAEGGFIHSGAFILVDKDRHVRGVYDGTKEESANKLIADIQTLLGEYNAK